MKNIHKGPQGPKRKMKNENQNQMGTELNINQDKISKLGANNQLTKAQ